MATERRVPLPIDLVCHLLPRHVPLCQAVERHYHQRRNHDLALDRLY